MNRWNAGELPRLPGRGHPVRVVDTATGRMAPAVPGPLARLYVCGITPYDATHLGHAATYVAFDLLNRAWRDAGLQVRYVQNVTDVDDPLLERAAATGVDWQVLAKEQTDLFLEDMAALGVLPPDAFVSAVESIPLIVEAVERLIRTGHAYRVPGADGEPDGDVYFCVHDDPRFGDISHLSGAQMSILFGQRGGDPDRPGKRHPLDCLLWRAERPNEPSWDGASLGRGRPGWHIECTTIALDQLGAGFDVQGGGADLKFPHHEMSAAQGHLLTGSWPYARAYVHTGLVGLGGQRMSKSRGNLVLVSRLRAAGVEPAAIRLALLAHHYREDWEWTEEDLNLAGERLARWRGAATRPEAPDSGRVLRAVRERMADDLDAPGAVAVLDAWADGRLEGANVTGTTDPATARGLIPLAVQALLGIPLQS